MDVDRGRQQNQDQAPGKELTPLEKAYMLIRAVEAELKLGTKHYDQNGTLLLTVREIVTALQRDRSITIEPTADRQHIFKGYCV